MEQQQIFKTIVRPTPEGWEIKTAEYLRPPILTLNKIYHGGGVFTVYFIHNKQTDTKPLIKLAKVKARNIIRKNIKPLQEILKVSK